jgi:hypothetical protein
VTDSSASCVLCDRDRIPYRGLVDEACRAWLDGLLVDLGDLHATTTSPADPVPDQRHPLGINPARPAGHWAELDRNEVGHDPLAADMPSGAGVQPNHDAIDITAPARPASRALFARGVLGLIPDQIGHLSLATTLDKWVRDWRATGVPGDVLPIAHVDAMLDWLRTWLDWACDQHARIDEFAEEMREYRSTMRGINGEFEAPKLHQGIPCPECGAQPLYQRHGGPRNGNLWIECQGCPHILKPDEFEEYCAVLREGMTRGMFRTTVTVVAWTRARRILAERRAAAALPPQGITVQ